MPITVLLVLLVCWGFLARRSVSAAQQPSSSAKAGTWNTALLVVTLLVALSMCATPVVQLAQGFRALGLARQEEKVELLNRSIDAARPAIALSILAPVVLIAGLIIYARNRRTRREAAQTSGEPSLE